MSKKKKSIGEALVVGTAIAGAALGAAAVFLSDKKNQDKLKKTVDEVSDEAVKIGKTVKKKVDEFTKNATKDLHTDEKPSKKTTVKKTVKKDTTTPTKVYTPKAK